MAWLEKLPLLLSLLLTYSSCLLTTTEVAIATTSSVSSVPIRCRCLLTTTEVAIATTSSVSSVPIRCRCLLTTTEVAIATTSSVSSVPIRCRCLLGKTEVAIATVPPPAALAQADDRLAQNLPGRSLPSVLPVSRRKAPHLQRVLAPLDAPFAPFPSFNSQQFDRQLQRYLRFLDQFGQPDILIVGSSRALQGIDPIVLQQTLANRGYPGLKIFNFGINGATAQLVDLLLRQLLTPEQLPRLILWADGVRAFNSGRVDITYNRAIASQGYQLLTADIRPTLLPTSLPTEASQTEPTCPVFSLARSAHETASQPKYFDFVAALKRHQPCQQPSKQVVPGMASILEKQTTAKLQEITGFQSLADPFKPEQYFRRYPNVRGAYDADYRDFTLNGEQTEAFSHVVTFAKMHQIPLIFVNLPLTQIYLDETRTMYEKQFRAYLQRVARSQPLSVYDLSQRWLYQNDYFMDPSHLNQYGATAVADQLGRMLVLPKVHPLAPQRSDTSR